MLIRRCAVLLLEPRERVEFDLDLLFAGETGLRSMLSWIALAPHRDGEVEVDAAERELLGRLGETQWLDPSTLDPAPEPGALAALLDKGLLLSDDAAHAHWRARDEQVRDTYWRPLSAVAHAFSRWEAVDAGAVSRETGLQDVADLVARYGHAPPQFHSRAITQRLALDRPEPDAFDALLQRRATCRNFDIAREVPRIEFSRLMHTVFGALAAVELTPGSAAVKKTSPSGGGLHATEAYLLVQRVAGVAPGLYHYHAGEHALEPLPAPAAIDRDWRALALRFVAGQDWFADAAVQVILAPRFRRSFWKYRNHAKAYRALILDAGHLSQTLYLTATHLGLGAFVTAAINEAEIERGFGLDPLVEGPLAICGFGVRADTRATVEFDPLHRVWPAEDH